MSNFEPSLLILSGVQGDPRRYRTFHLYEQARLAGLSCRLSHLTDSALRQKVAGASAVILHRAAYDSQVDWIEKDLHARGGSFLIDLDDLVFDPDAVQYIHSPDFGDPIRRSLYVEDINRIRKTLEISDHVITSSDYLAGRVRQLGKPASVHRNAFSLEMLSHAEEVYRNQKRDAARFVIGYASGSPTHDQDFALVKPALKSILSRHFNAELWLVGRLDPGGDWGEVGDRVKKLALVPWRQLPGILVQFDVNLAPLQIDNPFGQSKSEIKFTEAALVRVPTIASPSDAYSYAIRDTLNGFLAKDTQQWEQRLDELISSPNLRTRIGSSAYQDVLQHYHPSRRAAQLVDMLNTILGNKFELYLGEQDANARGENNDQSFWSCASIENNPTLIQRGLYSLKYRGLVTLLQQVWISIRRLVSPIFPYPVQR